MEYEGNEALIRFHEYPWNEKDEDYLYRISEINIGKMYHAFYVKITNLYKE